MTCPRDCPRWDGCSAPVCPLADDWRRCQHLSGDRVCGLMCELVKEGGEARLRVRLPGALVDTLADVAPQVAARWERVRMQLRRSAETGSRMAAGQRLAHREGAPIEEPTPTATATPKKVGCQTAAPNAATSRPIAGEGA